jgi:methanogenic corrinoid protein MtbC1
MNKTGNKSNSDQNAGVQARHPIGVVSRRTGIPQILLRAWERRYQAVVPERSATGRRLYSDVDIQRLGLMKLVVDAGRRISDVADMNLQDLQDLAAEDVLPVTPGGKPTTASYSLGDVPPATYLDHCLQAIRNLDRQRLESLLNEATLNFSRPVLRQELLVPLLSRIGEHWQLGELRVMHEHLASAVIRSLLAALKNGNLVPASAPRMVVTTPAGQLHEFGALLVTTAAVENGWDVSYLGPNLPAEEIAAAAQIRRAKVVALSIIYPGHDARVREELQNLRGYLGDDKSILVGGRAASTYQDVLEQIGAHLVTELTDLNQALESLAG